MMRFVLFLSFFSFPLFARAIVNTQILNKNIFDCQIGTHYLSFCKIPDEPIAGGYKYEMEFEVNYTFGSCKGGEVFLSFLANNEDHLNYSPIPHTTGQTEIKSESIKLNGKMLHLKDNHPEITQKSVFFNPCSLKIDSLSIDLSQNTKKILELYYDSIKKSVDLFPSLKLLSSNARIIKILLDKIDIESLREILGNIRDSLIQIQTKCNKEDGTCASTLFLINEINLELNTQPGLNDSELKKRVDQTLSEIVVASDRSLISISHNISEYKIKYTQILLSIKDEPYFKVETDRIYSEKIKEIENLIFSVH